MRTGDAVRSLQSGIYEQTDVTGLPKVTGFEACGLALGLLALWIFRLVSSGLLGGLRGDLISLKVAIHYTHFISL